MTTTINCPNCGSATWAITIDGPQRWELDTATNEAFFIYAGPGDKTTVYDATCKTCRHSANGQITNAIERRLPDVVEWIWDEWSTDT
jgi:hypothetical protein